MASTGVPLQKVLRSQVQQIFKSAGIPDSLTNIEIEARERLMQALYKNKGIEEAKNYIKISSETELTH